MTIVQLDIQKWVPLAYLPLTTHSHHFRIAYILNWTNSTLNIHSDYMQEKKRKKKRGGIICITDNKASFALLLLQHSLVHILCTGILAH